MEGGSSAVYFKVYNHFQLKLFCYVILTNISDVIVGVDYRSPSQDDNTNEIFFKELRDTSRSAIFVLMGDFNVTEVNWEYHTANTNRSRRLLKHLDDKCLVQIQREPTRKGALLDLLLVKRQGLKG